MRKIAFLTGTRADFGKIKSLVQVLQDRRDFAPYIFATGMHLMAKYGYTVIEIEKCQFPNIRTFCNETSEVTMDLTLAKTIEGFSEYVKDLKPSLIIVHGDRVEALAGAIVGSLNNILVAHIEGGEISGTVDELIRHSITKLSHIHFVSNLVARKRLIQMGELKQSIFNIGSPDVDIMFSKKLSPLEEVKRYYEIPFADFAIAMFHPVTTEFARIRDYAANFVNALLSDTRNYVVIFPNNDMGSNVILEEYERMQSSNRFMIFPSVRFEYFLVLLKNSQFIIGNSSAGIREAPYYGIPTINIGTRQENRALHSHIINTSYEEKEIVEALQGPLPFSEPYTPAFGEGNSDQKFLECLTSEKFWRINHQKQFADL